MPKLKELGFTVIELVVAIVVIVILATIVLSNVTSQNNKGKDAAIKGNLATLATRGTGYFEKNSNYNDFCTSNDGGAPVKLAIESAKIGSTFTCSETSTKWCACAPLKFTSDTFCVDSSNYKKVTSAECATRCGAGGTCSD